MVIHYYAGNITNISVKYSTASQTITCTSTGGPASEVIWSKDNKSISMAFNEEGLYEHSQIIINTISAAYENRLRIVDKSSKAAGTYTCEVTNSRGSTNERLYIQGIVVFTNEFILIMRHYSSPCIPVLLLADQVYNSHEISRHYKN